MLTVRRRARSAVLQALYAEAMGGGNVAHVRRTVLDGALREVPETADFAHALFDGVLELGTRADELVEAESKNWRVERMPLLDRLILRIAICEFLRFADIPPKSTVDEALELAKKFSTERSAPFINGVLDSVLYRLRVEGKLQKRGLGLKGMEELELRQDARRSQPDEAMAHPSPKRRAKRPRTKAKTKGE